MEQKALIIYGDGGELGNFKIFADSLAKELSDNNTTSHIKYINRDFDFFSFIESAKDGEISQVHIFTHAIGAGIFLGYKDAAVSAQRNLTWQMARSAGRKVSYEEAVRTEIGAIQTDDFYMNPIKNKRETLRKKLSQTAFIKVWGCNSGVENWVYSDDGITDPDDNSAPYYWRAFNEKNIPKRSIAQELANYFNKPVFGAHSGASIQVKYNHKWISTKQFKQSVGHWPSSRLPHRLVPDKGEYREHRPHN